MVYWALLLLEHLWIKLKSKFIPDSVLKLIFISLKLRKTYNDE